MLANAKTIVPVGPDIVAGNVEACVMDGIGIHLVGLADQHMKESLLRVVTALQACDYRIPGKKLVINIVPNVRQDDGSSLDLPIAIAALAASGQIDAKQLDKCYIVGELRLDGLVIDGFIMKDMKVFDVASLKEAIKIVNGSYDELAGHSLWGSHWFKLVDRFRNAHRPLIITASDAVKCMAYKAYDVRPGRVYAIFLKGKNRYMGCYNYGPYTLCDNTFASSAKDIVDDFKTIDLCLDINEKPDSLIIVKDVEEGQAFVDQQQLNDIIAIEQVLKDEGICLIDSILREEKNYCSFAECRVEPREDE